jgi:pimeloyl-ACP methyl ester carboxylesterase
MTMATLRGDFYTQRPTWESVTDGDLAGLELAGVAVPLDYEHPDGPATEITIGRHRATDPAQRLGVLLVGPGDDLGNPGLALTARLSASLPADIVARFDIVGFDLRFMGRSSPIDLEYTPAERYWVFHTPRDFDDEARIQSALAAKVGNPHQDLLGHLYTRNVARDIEVIRHVLGEEKISFIGYSYGTYLAAVYTQMFGEHADRVVMDSICSPDWVWRGLFTDFPPNGELALDRWSAWAARRDDQFGLGTTAQQVRARYGELLDRADRGELIPLDDFECDQTMIRLIAVGPLNSEHMYPALGEILRTAVHGGRLSPFTKPFLGQMFAPPESSGVVAQLSVLSGDWAWPRDPGFYRREMQSYKERYPFSGATLAGIKAPAFWPIQPREPVTRLGSDNPARSVLIVQSEHDMSTPYPAAVRMHEVLHHNSRLVTLADTAHHRVFPFYGDAGLNNVVMEYLVTGEMPDQDVVCRNAHPLQEGE